MEAIAGAAVCDLAVGGASIHFRTKGDDDFVPSGVAPGHSCSFIDPVNVAAYDEVISGDKVEIKLWLRSVNLFYRVNWVGTVGLGCHFLLRWMYRAGQKSGPRLRESRLLTPSGRGA